MMLNRTFKNVVVINKCSKFNAQLLEENKLDEDLERSLLFRPGGTSLVIHKYLSKDYPVGDKIACSVVRSEDGNQDVAHPPDGTLRSAEHPKRLDTPEGKIYRPPEGTTYRSPEGTPVKRP